VANRDPPICEFFPKNRKQSDYKRGTTQCKLASLAGVRLLDRSRHGAEPTEFGRAFADPTLGSCTVGGQRNATRSHPRF
jgi:hypothetical protein